MYYINIFTLKKFLIIEQCLHIQTQEQLLPLMKIMDLTIAKLNTPFIAFNGSK